MSLYRKYRPRAFSEVVGQDHIVTTLENAVKKDRLTHAYIFSGPRGTGKTSVARILAKAILTRGIEDKDMQKKIHQQVDDGSLIDLMEIDAASHTQVDNIRELIEKIQFSPIVAASKVYIIDEVHMLSKSAFNALLKTLEEPPDYAFFILATTELQKIPPTIQSRCQRYPFREINEEDIIRTLQRIVDVEHIMIDRPALRTIAGHVQGGMRDAIALLDQLRSLENVTVDDVKKRIGGTGQEYIENIFGAIAEHDADQIVNIVEKMEESAVPLDGFLREFLTAIRRRLHEAIREKNDIDPFVRMLDIVLEAIRDIRIAPVPGLVLESALLSLCDPKMKKSQTEKKSPSEESKKESAPSVSISPAARSFEAPVFSLDTLIASWSDILKEVHPPSVRMSLKTGRIVSARDETVMVSFPSAFHRDKVANIEASRMVEKILENMFKKNTRLRCALDDEEVDQTSEEVVDLAKAAKEVF